MSISIMSNDRAEKLYTAYTLCGILFHYHPEAIDKVIKALENIKMYYEYENDRLEEREYVVLKDNDENIK